MNPPLTHEILSRFQGLPWSGRPVFFEPHRIPNADRAFEAYITEATPELRQLYAQHKTELGELRLFVRSFDMVPYLMSIDHPATLIQRHSGLSASRASTSSITVPSPAGCVYLPFQLAGVDYARTHGNILIADEMGLGKTVQALGIFNDNPKYRSLLIVCPAYLKLNWMAEAKKWLTDTATFTLVEGRKFDYPPHPQNKHVVIINYDILGNHLPYLDAQHFDLVVMDECFIEGTPVFTRSGWKPIETIEIGEPVLSLDFLCSELEWKNVTATFKNPMRGRRLVTIRHEAGEFTCTEEHRIATSSGYKKAIEIACGESLLSLPNELFDANQRGRDGNLLLSELQWTQSVSATWSQGSSVTGNASQETKKGLLCVLDTIFRVAFKRAKILWEKLFSEMADVTARGKTQVQQDHRGSSGCKDGPTMPIIVSQNEGQQSVEYAWSAGENYSVAPGPHVPFAWRQRSVDCPAKKTRGSVGRGVAYGARHLNRWLKFWRTMLATMLQGRFSPAANQAGGGGGRGDPQNKAVEVFGPEKRARPQLSRVDCVEILEQGSGPTPMVYCLEVEGNHNFIAGGAVVSNCHYIKTPHTKRTLALLDLKAKRFIGLSGTPAVNRPIELWPILKRLLGRKMVGYWQFAEIYCNMKDTPRGKDVSGCSNPVALRNWLRANVMIRRLKSEVLSELPAKMRQVIELPPSASIKNVLDMENQKFAPHEANIIALKSKMDEAEIADDEATFHDCASNIAKEIQMGMAEIAVERKRLSTLKAPLIAHHIHSELSADPEMKIIVFTHHREACAIITEALAEFGSQTIHGGVSPADRQQICHVFQSVPESRVIVGTMGAMGTGLTLTASSRVLFVELDWRPGVMMQAEDRAHRIGQKDSVLCQYFLFPDSVESKMIGSVLEKMENLSQILDQGGKQDESVSKKPRAKTTNKVSADALAFYEQKITPDVKRLVLRGLRALAGMDSDRATRQDAKGFSKWDSPIGHRLASNETLTNREATFGLRMIYRYRRQIPDIAGYLTVAPQANSVTLVK